MSGRKPKVNTRSPSNVGEGPAEFRVELGSRIRWLLDQFSTRAEAAEIAGVSPEHLPSYIAGRAKPPFELIARLAATKQVSLDWLASGEGARTTGSEEPDGFVAVPVQADADTRFGGTEEESVLLFSRAWLRMIAPGPQDKLRIVVQRGNANEPAIRDGDTMLVDTSVERITDDALYVFARDARYLARFVETFIDGRVALKSRNPDYGMQTLSPEEAARLNVFGLVRWRGGLI
ncbi:MAG: S24 family peptidase [Rhizomicrobium sp.]